MTADVALGAQPARRAHVTAVTDTAGAAWLAGAAGLLIGIGAVASQPDIATLVLVLALLSAVAATLAPGLRILPRFDVRSVVVLVAFGIALLAVAAPARAPVLSIPYVTALVVLTVVGLHALIGAARWRLPQLAVVAIGFVALMAWMIAAAGTPDIDVYVFQQQGSAALMEGRNPFAMTFDLAVEADSPFYTPEVVDGDRLTFGFIYPPLSLLMALPGYVVAGDYRYGAAAALGLAAILTALIRPGRLAIAGALLLLFTPMTQQVLYWGWTDPFVILLLAATILLAVRNPAGTPVALGLLVASKQYMAPMLVLGAVLLREARRRVGLRRLLTLAVLVPLVTVAPFIVWDVGAFVYSTVTVHLLQPFRIDSLSIPAVIVRAGGPELPSVLSFLVAGLAMALVLWRAPRTPAGFSIGMAVVLLAFFLFSKQAFMHYYFLVVAMLACGVAATDLDPGIEPAAR